METDGLRVIMSKDERFRAPVPGDLTMTDNPPLVYCNNAASTWPKPPEVIDAVLESLRLPYFEAGRSTIRGLHDYPEICRDTISDLFRFKDPDHVVFTQNATDSLNILIHGFTRGVKGKFHVITTDIEHNSVLRPLMTLKQEGRIALSIVPSDSGVISPEAVSSAIRKDTRMAVISHGSNVIGSVQDMSRIGSNLRDHDIFCIIDGAQTAGLIPVDLGHMMPDAFVFTGHKYLFGLPGIGGFVIRDPTRVLPIKQGGTGVDSGSLLQSDEMPQRFETGTHNYPGIVSLCAGIRYVRKIMIAEIERKTREMTAFIIKQLADLHNVRIDNPLPDLPVISFHIDPLDCDDVGLILLKKYQIVVRTGLHCAPLIHERIDGGEGSVRISLSHLNTIDQCVYVADAISEVAQSADC
jgi:cysteine desulfurase / selenocysteine lyase